MDPQDPKDIVIKTNGMILLEDWRIRYPKYKSKIGNPKFLLYSKKNGGVKYVSVWAGWKIVYRVLGCIWNILHWDRTDHQKGSKGHVLRLTGHYCWACRSNRPFNVQFLVRNSFSCVCFPLYCYSICFCRFLWSQLLTVVRSRLHYISLSLDTFRTQFIKRTLSL